MSKVIFIDNKGQAMQTEVADYCSITLKIQDGKVTSVDHHESVRLQPILDHQKSMKNVAKTHENIAKTLI
ncbi:DUF2292 domain-containing protein [Enterococcus italicus]|uniref:Uncharacterized protein n=1 Tax=Enterococcus italicus (strain DSM 15952 / CCUG 50447 / LMG 22039 / TP 1.5) TaxID=888064 RepID=E6LEM7_ENTI1|nr:DUF2292 domain-containing protein [Enterococcus italicus]EFU74340.1 hypothetical protein HMPREF9088_0817 [Enterococcus italicus DSM 15952]OJG56785.1 hypothetical protein RT43_GL001422 [Enterococcus italicus DSM 15952]